MTRYFTFVSIFLFVKRDGGGVRYFCRLELELFINDAQYRSSVIFLKVDITRLHL